MTQKDKNNEYEKKYYEANKNEINEKKRENYRTHKTEISKIRKIRRSIRIDEFREEYRNMRLKVIEILGGKCIRCGSTNIDNLEIDHINGGGRDEIKRIGEIGIFKKIIKNPEKSKTEYQILCSRDHKNKTWESRSVLGKINKKTNGGIDISEYFRSIENIDGRELK